MNETGRFIKISISGESHSKQMYVNVSGLEKNIFIDENKIKTNLNRRNPHLFFNTQRKEEDSFFVVSGIKNSLTDGNIVKILVNNNSIEKTDYESNYFLRPGHADYTRLIKYGKESFSTGGGMASGRMTVLLTIAGSIAEQVLNQKGIKIKSHIYKIGNLLDDKINEENIELFMDNNEIEPFFPVINPFIKKEMLKLLDEIKKSKDSIGCVVETVVTGLDPGIGEPFFDSIESTISKLIFSIPATKGIEFGDGFDFANKKGSEVLDSFTCKNKKIYTKQNHNGGINGGISNGMPIVFRTVIKPTPTIGQQLESIDFLSKEIVKKTYKGNHDSFIGNRALVSIEGVTALALLDLIYERNRKTNNEKNFSGLLGENIENSLSPHIYSLVGITNYEKIKTANLAEVILKKNFVFLNITSPFKNEVIPYLFYQSNLVKKTKACNLIINTPKGLTGYNTDVYGFKFLLSNNNVKIKDKNVLILGNGSTSNTVHFVLKELEAKTITKACRTKRSENDVLFDEILPTKYNIIINTLPPDVIPPLNLKKIINIETAIDLSYRENISEFLFSFKNKGIKCVNGYDMLVGQAKINYDLVFSKLLSSKKWKEICKKIKIQNSNIVLIGMPTSNKTECGKRLQKYFDGFSVVDTDEAFELKIKEEISEFVEKHGIDLFRKREKEIIYEFSQKKKTIISTGGGVVLDETNLKNLSKYGILIYIQKNNFDDFVNDNKRPLIKSKKDLYKIYEERKKIYEKAADIIVEYNSNPDVICKEIQDALNIN